MFMAITLNKQPYKIRDVDIEHGTREVTNLELMNGWTAYNTISWGEPRIERVGHVVTLAGMIAGGTTTGGTVIFTIPEGLRPSALQTYAVTCGTSRTNVTVKANGDVTLEFHAPNNTYLSLSGIVYII